VAAGSDASIRKAAQRGFNLILDQYASPQQLGARIALYRAERSAAGLPGPGQIAVARQAYVANDRADAAAALEKQAAWTRRTVAVSRAPGAPAGSHVLAYANEAGGTEANALYGTADEIGRGLQALQGAGVEYVILTLLGGVEQLRRFAREVMPAFRH
jgi:alkanesulfonate monooxygenase SsuD/methylene tetrahydromethanopterin reductase-like flavin-dependent oxidoreductase (luciferase family)